MLDGCWAAVAGLLRATPLQYASLLVVSSGCFECFEASEHVITLLLPLQPLPALGALSKLQRGPHLFWPAPQPS
jgi:hypothetical protein